MLHANSTVARNSLPWQHLCQGALLPCKCHPVEGSGGLGGGVLQMKEGRRSRCENLGERGRGGKKEAVCLLSSASVMLIGNKQELIVWRALNQPLIES